MEPDLEPTPATLPCVEAAEASLITMVASGMPPADAVVVVLDGFGAEGVQRAFLAALDMGLQGAAMCAMLDRIACVDAARANACLVEGLRRNLIRPWKEPGSRYVGLHLPWRKWVSELPNTLVVKGLLNLSGCVSLAKLPDRLTVRGGCYLSGMTGIHHLPPHLDASDICMKELRVTDVPHGIRVRGYLDARCCRSLTGLPEGLSVGGFLSLNGCSSLVALPRGLRVGGNLFLRDCPAWDGIIPDDARISGDVVRG